MTNKELTIRIINDLNELIDHRGNTKLIPVLVEMRSFLNEIHDLKRQIAALEATIPPWDEEPPE